MRTCGEEVKARGAQLTIITDNPRLAEGLDPNPIVIPNNVRRGGGVERRRFGSAVTAAVPHQDCPLVLYYHRLNTLTLLP